MASDSLRQVGKYIKRTSQSADLALKRNFTKMPRKDRARDTVSNVAPFRMFIESDGRGATIDINFDKPPPADCASGCFATACQDFNLSPGGHSITVENPYEEGTMRVFAGENPLESVQWYEENPVGGQVYVQVPADVSLIALCYTYIIC